MQASGVLVGQVLLVLGIVLLGTWGATQYVASALAYQAQLGTPWFLLVDHPVFYPWQFLHWWYFYDVYAPHIFATGGLIAAGSSLVAVAVAIAMSVWRSRQSQLVTTYGAGQLMKRLMRLV